MHHCNGKMRFFCHLLVVSFVIEAVLAVANATASSTDSETRNTFDSDTKNKRQVNQYIRTPGTSAATSVGTESGPQVFPLQLSHSIYQQRLPLYTRRPTTVSKPQVTEDVNEQEPQQQQQQQQSILPSYYNFVPDIDADSPDSVHIDSRHLPVEPRTKVQNYQSTQPQRVQISYSSVAPKQSTPSQTLFSEDEYLELIRNTDLVKSSQGVNSKIPFGYVTAAPTTAIDNMFEYSTKSQLNNNKNNNDYRKYTSRTHLPSTPSSVPHLQPQTSQQQFVRQPPQYIGQPTHYTAVTPAQDFEATYDKDTVRVNLKKYQESAGKTKYDPARGQYHQEVSVKPTKKSVNFKPSYQYASTAQTQSSSSNRQQSVGQSEPLHYQSVEQIIQTELTKANQQNAIQTQSQYSNIVPQSQVNTQQAYFPAEVNHPFQSYVPQHERLVANNNYGQIGSDQTNLPTVSQQIDNKQNGQSEFRIQYVHHVSQTPTPTPTPRFVTDVTSQPLKYELFDPSGNRNGAKEVPPKIKLIPAPSNGGTSQRPQYVDQPQYYKKVKIQPAAHVHYVPVRTQYHQPTQQPIQVHSSQSAQSPQSDILIPIQPSRSALFVAQSSGHSESVSHLATGNVKKLTQSIPSGHQTLTDPRKPPLPITSPKKPISQEEFQALLDAGYKVQAIPVPVPVSIDKYKQLQYQQQQRQQHHTQPVHSPVVPHHPSNHPAQHTRQYIRYHPKQESEEGILTSYLKPLIDYIGGPSQ
ncbi:putative uncharacterized protein DDB_G0291608 [Contarinia nasturtii]|uniref:putative uncharacterized protein DDB_G0291608 n=1 Tax=Contarinia nasturtii TaxID=265458 RepID=UPI0012D4B69B|nr:putative uncharacterized protein DDB_G0291608 [Contarinia nasturtii]